MNKILLTGHKGFLGQYVCQRAKQRDLHIIGVSRTRNPELEVKEIQLDLSKNNFIDQLKDQAFDGVIHNAKVDYLTFDAGLFQDDGYISCLGCIDDFNLDNQMYETPRTYWQIKYPDLSNEIPEYF